jgi:glycosidase
MDTWLRHGLDGIRMDAVKLIPAGRLKAYDGHIYSKASVFIFGEWYDGSSADLWPDEV